MQTPTEQSSNNTIPKWKVLDSKDLLKTPWVTISEEKVELGNGKIMNSFFVVKEPSWSCSVAVTPSQNFIFIEQYRRAADAVILELPGGTFTENEDPANAAVRELEEETGYKVLSEKAAIPLGQLKPEPNRNTNVGHGFLVFVEEEAAVAQNLDEHETIRVTKLSLKETLDAVATGKIIHSCHVAFLYRAFIHLGILSFSQ